MNSPKKILVGIKTPEHAVELTNYACMIGGRDASLLLVHVMELPDVTPLNAELPELEANADKMLAKGQEVARQYGMNAHKLTIRAHGAGTALLETLKEEKIELAVLGYHHRKTLGEILLGTTAQHLIHKAPCHILLSVPPKS